MVRPFTADQVQLFRGPLVPGRRAARDRRLRQDAHGAPSGCGPASPPPGSPPCLGQHPALRDLAANPLLLTMIATAHRYRGALPGSRADLYGEICHVLLSRRGQAKDLPELLSWPAKQALLAALAYQMMREHVSSLPADRVLEILRPAAGALPLVGHRRGVPRRRLAQRPAHRGARRRVLLRAPDLPGVPGRPARQRQPRSCEEPRRQRRATPGGTRPSCCTRRPPTPARSSAPAWTAARSPPSPWPSTAAKPAPRSILTCASASTRNAGGHSSRTAPPEHRRLIAGVTAARLARQTLTTAAGTRICARPVPADLYWLFLADTQAPRPDSPCDPRADQPATGIWGTEAQAFVQWLNSITATATGIEVRLPRHEELQEEAIASALSGQLPASVTGAWTQPRPGTVASSWPAPSARAERHRARPGNRRRRREHRHRASGTHRGSPQRRPQYHPRP